MKTKYQNRGFITAAISAAILVLGIVAMFALTDVGTRFRVAGTEKERANDTAQITLEELLNRPWSHPDLDATKNDHVRDNLKWTVTDIPNTRLKKIELTSTIQSAANNASNTLTVTGYKYDDLQK